MRMLTYVLAVLAACANAISSVLQRKANREVPRNENLSLKLIWSLVHEPVWFGGILAVAIGFLLQATALGAGELAVVEPILVLELPATLILAALVFHARMRWQEWTAAIVMTAGLGGLLFFLSPSAGRSTSVRWYVWVIGIAANLLLIGALVLWGKRRPAERSGRGGAQGGAHRAAVLGVAGGAAFGLTAALMKGMTTTYSSGGFANLFTSWQLYAMIVSGASGMFLVQSAMNAGRLLAAQPGLTLSDPIVSIIWGILVFHERVRGGVYIALAVGSGVVMAGAVVALARSPLLGNEAEEPGGDQAGEAAGTREANERNASGGNETAAAREAGETGPVSGTSGRGDRRWDRR
jgi:drug/metabolite transporter (DMT)-like permease